MIGEERSVVHDMPGTTRDAIDTVVETSDGPLCFVDTAGMRRPSKTDRGTEHHSVLRALDALERADIALLVIDATVGATHQDQRLAERIGASGCPAVVVLNKWDALETERRDDILYGVSDKLAFLGTAPSSGVGIERTRHPQDPPGPPRGRRRLPPAGADRCLEPCLRDIQAAHPAPGARIRYGVQGAIDPPTFTLFATGDFQPPTCATSSVGSASTSTSGPRRSRCGSAPVAVAEERSVPWCDDCDRLVDDEDLTEEGTCPVCDTQLVEPERRNIPGRSSS